MRLTSVATQNGRSQPLVDPLFEQGASGPVPITSASQQPTPVTEIRWSPDDALTFPVCISSTFLNSNNDEHLLSRVSIILGNVVLADQGLLLPAVQLPTVPEPSLFRPRNPAADRCRPTAPVPFPVRYQPPAGDSPITQAVSLPLAGSPVTPNAVPLLSVGSVSLTDANGITCLMVRADGPLLWPQYFGVLAAPNATNPANFDLTVVFDPQPGGRAGVTGPVHLEQLTNLTLTPGSANYAVTQLNTLSRFVEVPASYTPPAANPTRISQRPDDAAKHRDVRIGGRQ